MKKYLMLAGLIAFNTSAFAGWKVGLTQSGVAQAFSEITPYKNIWVQISDQAIVYFFYDSKEECKAAMSNYEKHEDGYADKVIMYNGQPIKTWVGCGNKRLMIVPSTKDGKRFILNELLTKNSLKIWFEGDIVFSAVGYNEAVTKVAMGNHGIKEAL
jgi:hypothetical protein